MDAFRAWLAQLQFDGVWQTAVLVAASLLCITFHETCHGLAAYRLGDNTAKRMGRLSLNPLKHVDLMGLIMMALFRFGWAKPVPVDMRNFKNPKAGMALTALAGPVSNVVLAYAAVVLCNFVMFLADRLGSTWLLLALAQFFVYVEIISAGLAVFNVFPIPPLDGSKVLFALLSDRAYDRLMRYEKYGMGLLMALLVTGAIDRPLGAMRDWLLTWLNSLGAWGYTLPSAIF
ncbi:MAG: site-2 protease family protein [Oscillospiraceae bacterium]|jgi:Zn-dependent protease|nr:site-2 protease family protein [Bacillota bacterium]